MFKSDGLFGTKEDALRKDSRPPALIPGSNPAPAAGKTVEFKQLGHRGTRLAPVLAVHCNLR